MKNIFLKPQKKEENWKKWKTEKFWEKLSKYL
jgi:hypothetical protein